MPTSYSQTSSPRVYPIRWHAWSVLASCSAHMALGWGLGLHTLTSQR